MITANPPCSTTPAEIKPIPASFDYDGYRHELVERDGNRAIFQKFRPVGFDHSFEVVLIEYRGAEKIGLNEYPAREVYPRNEDWGRKGWTCMTLNEARKKMKTIKG